MPNRKNIQTDILDQKQNAQDILRKKYLAELAAYTERDTILYFSAFAVSKSKIPGQLISVGSQDMNGFMSVNSGLKRKSLE